MKKYKDLNVWKKAMKLTIDVYKTTRQFPKYELYGLTSQIRRSAVSMPSNIAEGAGRTYRKKGTNKEFSRFLDIALGSSAELETQLILAHELEYMNNEIFLQLSGDIEEIQKMLYGLQKSFDL